MTIEEKIQRALGSRVAALVLSPPLTVAWPNNVLAPEPPYLRVDYFPNRNQRIVIKGSGPHRRLGILQLTVVSPLNVGPDPSLSIAGRVAEHFPADMVLHYDGVSVRIIKAPDILPASKEAASWDVPVSVEYECFA
jgi:hypothetical protein